MDIKGKKIVCLGDSITAGSGASKYENCWVSLLGEKIGADVRNFGIGGTRIARQQFPTSPDDVFDRDFCLRAPEMDKDADVVIVFGGTNDYGHGDAEMGSFEDSDPNTFCGALNWLFTYLRDTYPNAQKVILTPLHRRNENNLRGDGCKKKDYPVLSEYVENIRLATDTYGFRLLDLFKDSGIDPNRAEDDEKYYTDGLHPNDTGHALLAEMVYEFLKNI